MELPSERASAAKFRDLITFRAIPFTSCKGLPLIASPPPSWKPPAQLKPVSPENYHVKENGGSCEKGMKGWPCGWLSQGDECCLMGKIFNCNTMALWVSICSAFSFYIFAEHEQLGRYCIIYIVTSKLLILVWITRYSYQHEIHLFFRPRIITNTILERIWFIFLNFAILNIGYHFSSNKYFDMIFLANIAFKIALG